jgi:dolichol-phosphate mannosyltransferase
MAPFQRIHGVERGLRVRSHPIAAVLGWLLFGVQAALAVRVFARMARTIRGERINRVAVAPAGERAVVVVPVLDEEARLDPCLAGLHLQGPELAAVFVVDGGSRDGTLDLARAWAARDARVRVVEAGPAPAGSNGKVHNLARGLIAAEEVPEARWLLTIDADVRPALGLVAALLAHARDRGLAALSAATQQRLSGAAEAVVHPSLLASLVYRFGVPGHATTDPAQVQANGQCMLLRRDVLARAGGFAPLAHAIAEDVALARRIAPLGEPVGFFETDGLVSAEMYAGPREALVNWSRSLPMVEGQPVWRTALGLAEVVLVQAAPLLVVALLAKTIRWPARFKRPGRIDGSPHGAPNDRGWGNGSDFRAPRARDTGAIHRARSTMPRSAMPELFWSMALSRFNSRAAAQSARAVGPTVSPANAIARRLPPRNLANGPGMGATTDPMPWLARLNLALLAARVGTLAGMARAYPDRPAAYWLSPGSDAVVAAALLLRTFRRRHAWRGRTVVRGG